MNGQSRTFSCLSGDSEGDQLRSNAQEFHFGMKVKNTFKGTKKCVFLNELWGKALDAIFLAIVCWTYLLLNILL